MTKTKVVFSIVALFTFYLLNSFDCFAQSTPRTQIEPSYEVILQSVVGSSNNAAKSDAPQSLSGVIKKLRANYSFSNYRLISTSMQRVANTGTIEAKSISNQNSAAENAKNPVFSEWTLSGLQSFQDSKGQSSVQFQSFRFGQRIPLINTFRDDGGKTSPMISYEPIGLTISRFSLPVNVPTVIGSLSASQSEDLMFLILTVKPAE
jgi:hypothetical protein